MTYDPFTEDRSDPHESIATQRTETGRSEMVIGILLLLFALISLVFVGWDIKGGNMFMQVMFYAGLLGGLALIGWGAFQRSRGIGRRDEND